MSISLKSRNLLSKLKQIGLSKNSWKSLRKTNDGPVIPRVQKCTDPVVPVIQRSTKEKITINGRTHSLPTTKDYLLQEHANEFQGIGTLPGGPCSIQLKKGYKPVQHPPRQVAVSLKPLYKAELERLTQLGVTK